MRRGGHSVYYDRSNDNNKNLRTLWRLQLVASLIYPVNIQKNTVYYYTVRRSPPN